MNREEAMEYGMEIHETQHSMKRRSPWHDYCKKNTYMLTLVVEGRMPLLGELKGNADAATRSADAPRIELPLAGQSLGVPHGEKDDNTFRVP